MDAIKVKPQPFHESVIKAINDCSVLLVFDHLAALIKATVIPKNHDAIISAWQQRIGILDNDDRGVTESVLKQKIGTESCIINLDFFKAFKKHDSIGDAQNKVWVVDLANCGGPGKFTTHLLRSPQDELEYIFHDGEYMRFLREDDKELDGAKVGDFIKRWQPA